MTPASVVNWLYQGAADVVSILRFVCGSAAIGADGKAGGDGIADVALMWGSHLGSARDQALIAWDYDVDMALFFPRSPSPKKDGSREQRSGQAGKHFAIQFVKIVLLSDVLPTQLYQCGIRSLSEA